MPAMKKKDKVTATDRKKKESVKVSFFSRFNEEQRIRIRKVAGIAIGAFALFTLISVMSYMFTWKEDYSLLNDTEMMDRDVAVSNLGGKLGYRWAYFLVTRCFGLGSFALVVLLFAAAARLFYMKRTVGLFRTTILTVSGALIVSLIASYLSGLIGSDLAFGGGLGGDCGAVVTAWAGNLIGAVATGLVILIFVVIWLLYASGTFAGWFIKAGEGERKVRNDAEKASGPAMPVPPVEEPEEMPVTVGGKGQTALEPGEDGPVSVEPVDDSPFYVEELPVSESVVREPVLVEEDSGAKDERTHGGEEIRYRGDNGVVVEGGLEVVGGEGLSTDVTEELPRIDVRADLEKYEFPPLDLLKDYSDRRHEVPTEELERNNNKIRATLLNYKIQVEKVTARVGPTVTLYKITLAPGVKISAVRNLEEDIAVALGVKGVRVVVLADAVGIEVANDRPSTVPLKSLLNDSSFREGCNKYELPIAIGYTITQKVKIFDLADAPHLLVAGATKQGKSVGLNVMVASLLYSKHPSELKLVFVDPKRVEFTAYGNLLKHYLAVLPTAADENDERQNAIVKDAKHADEILRSLCMEMDERYILMSKSTTNNIKLYNEKYKDRHLLPTDGHRFMPYIVAIIDEYSDLLMAGTTGEAKALARNIESSIIRLAQMGRAAGIHLIIATQRPSVDVITGRIKANFPTRIAFRTLSSTDSKTILDSPGADKLIGRGDMLYYAGVEMERVQCALIEMDEVSDVTRFIGGQTGYRKSYSTPYYLPMPETSDGEGASGMINMDELDEMFRAAAEMVVINQQGSTSTLQRKLGMGYARAGRVMDQLEAAGIVGPQEGSKPRQVLVADLSELNGILSAYGK